MSTAPVTVRLCTLRLGEFCFGVDVARVREVIRFQHLTPVPLAPPAVAGLMNLRGEIVTALDLRALLGHPPRGQDAPPAINVIVHIDGGVVSLLVDGIGDVADVAEASLEASPPTLQGIARQLVPGTYALPDQLLLLLDVDRAAGLVAAGGV